MNPKVDKYLIDGCMRCKYGATPACKVNKWRTELETLRKIVLDSGLTEDLKWGIPVYTLNGKNVVNVGAFKEYAFIGFFKGVLLRDAHKMLSQQGNIQSSRIIRFINVTDIVQSEEVLKQYIKEAIAIEENGKKPDLPKRQEPVPEELLQAFEEDPLFEKAFKALTPGRQRGYILFFSQPQQSETRKRRIEKNMLRIFDGLGLHDK